MPIKLKIDVTKILKQHLFNGKEKGDGSKPVYLDVVLWETPDDKYNKDFRVVQELNREARDAGERGPILGNGEHFGSSKKERSEPRQPPPRKEAPPQRKPPVDPDLDAAEDDIPF